MKNSDVKDLRRLMITKHDDASGAYTYKAYFHGWVKVPHYTETITVEETLGLIEFVDDYKEIKIQKGMIRKINPNRIKFVESFDEPI